MVSQYVPVTFTRDNILIELFCEIFFGFLEKKREKKRMYKKKLQYTLMYNKSFLFLFFVSKHFCMQMNRFFQST